MFSDYTLENVGESVIPVILEHHLLALILLCAISGSLCNLQNVPRDLARMGLG